MCKHNRICKALRLDPKLPVDLIKTRWEGLCHAGPTESGLCPLVLKASSVLLMRCQREFRSPWFFIADVFQPSSCLLLLWTRICSLLRRGGSEKSKLKGAITSMTVAVHSVSLERLRFFSSFFSGLTANAISFSFFFLFFFFSFSGGKFRWKWKRKLKE